MCSSAFDFWGVVTRGKTLVEHGLGSRVKCESLCTVIARAKKFSPQPSSTTGRLRGKGR